MLLVSKATKGLSEPLVPPASKVTRDQLGPLVPPASRETKGLPELLALPELRDLPARVVTLGQLLLQSVFTTLWAGPRRRPLGFLH